MSRRCSGCHKTLPITEFYKKLDDYAKSCKRCQLAKKAYRQREKVKSYKLNPRTIDITGQKFARIQVVSFAYSMGERVFWNCTCDCGNTAVIRGNMLRSGHTTSCGCYAQEVKETPRQPLEVTIQNKLFGQVCTGAKMRELDFSLTHSDVMSLTSAPCHYCGVAPSNTLKYKGEVVHFYSGIDRKDSSQGYILDNCVPCCIQCNVAKNDYTLDEFRSWVTRVYLKIGDGHED